MTGWRTALGAALSLGLCALTGCAETHDVQGQAIAYNFAADDVNNQIILLNFLRAGNGRPAEWTSTRLIQGQVTVSGGLGLLTPFGPRGGNTFGFELLPSAAASGQSQFQIDALDVREFYQYYLKEIKPDLIAYYEHDELDLALYYLFFSKIIVSTPDRRFVANNNPGGSEVRSDFRPTFHKFEQLLWAFFDARLVPEHIAENPKIGPPLTGAQVTQELRAIVSGTTKDGGLSLKEEDKDAKKIPDHSRPEKIHVGDRKQTAQYQLQKSEESDRYCFREEEWRVTSKGSGRGYGTVTPPHKHFPGDSPGIGRNDWRTVALGLRCGATSEERKKLEDLQINDTIEAPNLTVIDTDTKGYNDISLSDYLARYCEFVERIKQITGILPDAPSGKTTPISIKILTRSPDEVVGYLGQIATFASERGKTILVPGYPADDARVAGLQRAEPCGDMIEVEDKQINRYVCYKLLDVRKNGALGPAFVSATYEGNTYWVPKDEPGNTFTAFEIVHQLIALAKVAKDLPAAAILSVNPLP